MTNAIIQEFSRADKEFKYAILGLAFLSTLGIFKGNLEVKIASVALFFGSVSAGFCSKYYEKELERYQYKLEQENEIKLTEAEREVRRQIQTVQLEVNDKNQQIADLRANITKLSDTIKALHSEYDTKLKELFEHGQTALTKKNESHSEEIQKLMNEYDDKLHNLQTQYEKAIEELKTQYTSQLKENELVWSSKEEEYETLIERYQAKLEELPHQFELQIQQGKAENQTLREVNEGLLDKINQFSKPRIFEGSSRAEYNGNKVLDFYGSHKIYCDAVKAESKHGHDEVWIKPRGLAGLEDFRKHLDGLYLALGTMGEPEVEINSGCIVVRMPVEPILQESKLKDTDLKSLLTSVIKDGNHLRVNGQRDSGKSTFANNVLALIEETLPGIKKKLINPLAHSPKSNWDMKANWDSYEASLDGLQALVQEIENRSQLCREAKENGKKTPKLEPILWIIDELDTIISTHREPARDFLKKALKTGTHFNVFTFMIGQTPNCSELKLYKADFLNTCSLYLGANIPRGINESCVVNQDEIFWKNQLRERQKLGQKYLAFVSETNGRMSLSELPKPNEWVTEKVFAEVVSTEAEKETIDKLEKLYKSDYSENLEGIISQLQKEGVTKPSDIVYSIWQLRPSKSNEYKKRANQVRETLKKLGLSA